MEINETGKASDTAPGDEILIRFRKLHKYPKKESERVDDGYHAFDLVEKILPTGDAITFWHGSLNGNTTVKKVGPNEED